MGTSLRHDRARVGLFDSVARQITTTVREDKLRESLLGVYAQTEVDVLPNRLRGCGDQSQPQNFPRQVSDRLRSSYRLAQHQSDQDFLAATCYDQLNFIPNLLAE